ncbi:MAG: amidohydrolase family protein [Chloroflexota bacterium]|nr:amidohydrolase family protein [Chloroflexota bacterium]
MIDVTVLVGGSARLHSTSEYSLSATCRELRAHGVSRALIGARAAAHYRHEVGNDLALAAARQNGLYPVASLNPVQYLDWPRELARMRAAGAVALRFFPDVQGWTVHSAAFQEVARAARCPMLLPVCSFGDATAIGGATAELGVPVVLVGAHYTQLADCLAALERWPHLYLDTSRLAHFRAIETVVRSLGPGRLLFGSGAPRRPIQAALNAVLSADISDTDRRAILADNASLVFGLPRSDFVLPSSTRASGLTDVHTHVGALGFPTPRLEPAEQSAALAGHGIVAAVASSLRAIADDLEVGNAEAFATSQPAYVVVNPNDLDGSCRMMDDAYRREVAVGAKLHCGWSGVPTASRACIDLVRQVARRGRPLAIHVDGDGWDEALAAAAAEFPGWKVIVTHAGPGTPSPAAARLVERTDNVFVELCTSFPDRAICADLVRRAGTERVLFGSDAPLLDPSYVLGIYADAGVDLPRTARLAREVLGV